jgi:putative sterol carrier protein
MDTLGGENRMPRYGTVEFFKEFKKLVDADPMIGKLLKGCDTTITYKVTDKPDIKPVIETIKDGKIVEIRELKPDDKPEYSYWAAMSTWKGIATGELDQMKALTSQKLGMQGPLMKMQKFMKGWVKLAALQSKVANTTWE